MEIKYDHLLGRPFQSIGDCYRLGRELFHDNFGIELENYACPNDWNSDDIDLIELLYERTGFEKITNWRPKDLRPGDVLVMAIGEQNANHFAVFVGDSKIVHHLYGRLSRVEELRDFWFNSTCYILRHPDVPDLRPVHPDINIMELINAARSSEVR